MSLRYYLYVSDAKVDMLLPQVDPGLARKRAGEVGVNLPFLTAKRQVESPAPERVVRLERVVRHLDDFGDVGTIDEPGQYFRGRLRMRWAPLGAELVYFAGSTEDTVVGLGGGSGHVLGTSGSVERPVAFAPSSLPRMIGGLAAALAADAEPSGNAVPGDALGTAHQAHRRLRGVEQELEFLAKRLQHGPSPYPELDPRDGMRVLLGSPLFVALAD